LPGRGLDPEFENAVRVIATGGKGDADARRHGECVGLDRQRLADRGQQLPGNTLGVRDRMDGRKENDEFVATEPGHEVAGTNLLP
jgi:hypothetical protein